MNIPMKDHARLLLVLSIGLVILSGCTLPRRSEQSIRQRILRDTPQGSSYSTVLLYAEKQGWTVTEQSSGVETKNLGQFPAQVVGRRAIKAHLGGYQGLPWRIDVVSYWAFDENNKLIEVFVSKQADAP